MSSWQRASLSRCEGASRADSFLARTCSYFVLGLGGPCPQVGPCTFQRFSNFNKNMSLTFVLYKAKRPRTWANPRVCVHVRNLRDDRIDSSRVLHGEIVFAYMFASKIHRLHITRAWSMSPWPNHLILGDSSSFYLSLSLSLPFLFFQFLSFSTFQIPFLFFLRFCFCRRLSL